MSKLRFQLTIADGETESEALDFNDLRFLSSVLLFAPDTLPETVTVEVTAEREPASGDWRTLQSGGSDVVIAAGKATALADISAYGLRCVAGSAVGADRVIDVVGAEMA